MINGISNSTLYKNKSNKLKEKGNSIFNNIIMKDREIYILSILGFFIGRVYILNSFSAFASAFIISLILLTNFKNVTISFVFVVAGLITRGMSYQIMQFAISIILVYSLIKIVRYDLTTYNIEAAILIFITNFICTLIFIYILKGNILTNDVLASIFNSMIVITLIYIYNFSIPYVINYNKRSIASGEEIICISILYALFIAGFSNLYVWGVNLENLISLLLIILISYAKGLGAGVIAGVTIGFITCLSSSMAIYAIAIYAFCGLLSGIFRSMNKIGSVIGFMTANLIMMFYITESIFIISLKDMIIAVVIFLLLPNSIIQKISLFLDSNSKNISRQKLHLTRDKDIIEGKIMNISDTFNELAMTLLENEELNRIKQNDEINRIINSIVDKVCSNCEARNICWERDFYNTYQNIFNMIDVIEEDGSVNLDNVPFGMKENCLKIGQFTKTANYTFDLYRMNYKWRCKALESKKVISEELSDVSNILKNLCYEFSSEVEFKGDIEEEIELALDRKGIKLNDISVFYNKHGRLEIYISKNTCYSKRECIKDIAPIISKTIGKNMIRDRNCCKIDKDTGICSFKLIEYVNYQFIKAIAREIKDKDGFSGDNYTFIEHNDGKYLVALSDGMGTGPSAALESNYAITLLEKYIESGFNYKTAIKSVNSIMNLKSIEDNFTTIDLILADLYTATAQIIKVGAAATYIKRFSGDIEKIGGNTLPAGILNNVDIDIENISLSHGDMIIMMTDGVCDAGKNMEIDWVKEELIKINTRNPQEVAESLIKIAKQKNDNKIIDDMTVIALKICKV